MSKRRGEGDYSSSSNEKQKANKSHGNFDLDDSSHKEFDSLDAEVELHTEVVQKLSESVVSLSFIGDHEQYQYTGLVIQSDAYGSRFVTSATAIRSKEGGRKINRDMSIHVSLPNGQMIWGSCYQLILTTILLVSAWALSMFLKKQVWISPGKLDIITL